MSLHYTDLVISGVFAGHDVWHERLRIGSIKPVRDKPGWAFYPREISNVPVSGEPCETIPEVKRMVEREWKVINGS